MGHWFERILALTTDRAGFQSALQDSDKSNFRALGHQEMQLILHSSIANTIAYKKSRHERQLIIIN